MAAGEEGEDEGERGKKGASERGLRATRGERGGEEDIDLVSAPFKRAGKRKKFRKRKSEKPSLTVCMFVRPRSLSVGSQKALSRFQPRFKIVASVAIGWKMPFHGLSTQGEATLLSRYVTYIVVISCGKQILKNLCCS